MTSQLPGRSEAQNNASGATRTARQTTGLPDQNGGYSRVLVTVAESHCVIGA
jgi:hypothetical protein